MAEIGLSRNDAFMILNALPRIGWITLKKLLDFVNQDPVKLLSISQADLEDLGVSKKLSATLSHWEEHFNLEKEKSHLAKLQAEFLSFEHPDYPSLLKMIYDPPIGLYYYGPVRPALNTIAILGSRQASLYGLQVAERLASDLAERGWCVLSGFARGIDTAAHRGALRVQGLTAGVLGCAVDRIYPPENVQLYHQLREQGCLISEFCLGARADRMSFPRRNRILSGMSQATVVVESALKGGSMLTAAFALDHNRQVFAVPGRIDSDMSRGCNNLIRNGATLVTCVDDILEDLHAAPPMPLKLEVESKIQELKRDHLQLPKVEQDLLQIIKYKGPLGSSQLLEEMALSANELQTLLFDLELNQWIVRRNDGLFEA